MEGHLVLERFIQVRFSTSKILSDRIAGEGDANIEDGRSFAFSVKKKGCPPQKVLCAEQPWVQGVRTKRCSHFHAIPL